MTNNPENVKLHRTYADNWDNVYAAHSSTQPQEATDDLAVHAESVRDWAEEKGL